jgi:hypothetical protein
VILRAALAAAILLGGTAPVEAASANWERCFVDAAVRYRVSPLLLRAIARQESSFRADAVNENTNGTRDIGVMQINTWWLDGPLGKAGITEDHLFQPCVNIHVGAWILANEIQRHGVSWKAIGSYHSPTEWRQADYARRIHRHLVRELRAMGKNIAVAPPPAAEAAPTAELADARPAVAKPAGGVWEADSAGAEGVDTVKPKPAKAPEGERADG